MLVYGVSATRLAIMASICESSGPPCKVTCVRKKVPDDTPSNCELNEPWHDATVL